MRHSLRGFAALTALASILGLPASASAGTQYQYDAFGRLTRVTYDSGIVVQYSYDAAGNRTQVISGPAVANNAPVANGDTASVNTSAAVDVMVRANDSDPDGDALTVTAVGTPSGGGTVAIQGGGTHVRYAAPSAAGTSTFTYTVSDGRGGTAAATVTVSVVQANRSPVAVNDSASVNTSSSVDVMVRANDSDPDGDALTVTAVGTPSGGGTVAIQGGGTHARYTAPSTAGAASFTYTVSDGRGGAATATATVNVVQPNRAPVTVNDTAYADTLTTVSIPVLANDSDPDGQALTVIGVTTPTGGAASIAPGGGAVNYNAPSTAGTYTFQYTASDGAGGTATGSVSVVVQKIIIEDPGCLTGGEESLRPPPGCL